MDSRISSLKKIIRVFRQYGIVIIGKRKFDNFYHDLHMDKVFVNGLIFEVEYALRKDISEESIVSVSTPLALVNAFL
jgi:acyl carrier protein